MASGGKLVKLIHVEFEIFGLVQGVFFRKNTQKEAKKLELVGWVMNTKKGTVKGEVQGPEEKINLMKHWLSKKGSSHSRIDKADFNDKNIEKLEFTSFSIRH